MNFANTLHAAALRTPGAIAVTHGNLMWAYGEFSDRVARTASFLRALPGMELGARVALASETVHSFYNYFMPVGTRDFVRSP